MVSVMLHLDSPHLFLARHTGSGQLHGKLSVLTCWEYGQPFYTGEFAGDSQSHCSRVDVLYMRRLTLICPIISSELT